MELTVHDVFSTVSPGLTIPRAFDPMTAVKHSVVLVRLAVAATAVLDFHPQVSSEVPPVQLTFPHPTVPVDL